MEFLEKLGKMLTDRSTPEIIEKLEPAQVFVFGTKPEGIHTGGAAAMAVSKFGAVPGIGEGMRGQSYALPVHRHQQKLMRDAVSRFIRFAKDNPDLSFMGVPVGCGKAGMDVDTVANMFVNAVDVENIFLPKIFIQSLRRNYRVREDMDLPIHYVDEKIAGFVLRGRLIRLMAEISKRTDNPIKLDEIIHKDNPLLNAYLRIIYVMKPEEQRVMGVLMDEAKRMDEMEEKTGKADGTLHAIGFLSGWYDAEDKLEKGGSMYDLLEFTNRDLL